MKEKLAYSWAVATFGVGPARSIRERSCRIVEEAVELGQSCGLPKEDVHRLVDIIFSRPQGDRKQEVGGVIVTLSAFCGLMGYNIESCFETEFARCIEKQPEIAKKAAAKDIRYEA